MATHTLGLDHDPDLTAGIGDLVREVVSDPDAWKQTPNPVLGGRRPEEFIGQPDEHVLRDLLRAAKHGMMS